MHAVDIAPTFIRHALGAENANPLGIAFTVADSISPTFAEGAFDFVTAFMSGQRATVSAGAKAYRLNRCTWQHISMRLT
jgi:hypothetical protein